MSDVSPAPKELTVEMAKQSISNSRQQRSWAQGRHGRGSPEEMEFEWHFDSSLDLRNGRACENSSDT